MIMSEVRKIHCASHGEQEETFVCGHIVKGLRDNVPYGFWWVSDSDKPRPDALCTSCNEMLAANGGKWDERTGKLAEPALLCGECYDIAKAVNIKKHWWQIWK
jgi:hypothetical protein